MHIKGKLKHFIWRCNHNILSTRSQMARKGIQGDQTCNMCGEGEENLEHLFFKCRRAQVVWKLALVKWDGLEEKTVSFPWWWQKLCSLSLDQVIEDRIQLSVYIL